MTHDTRRPLFTPEDAPVLTDPSQPDKGEDPKSDPNEPPDSNLCAPGDAPETCSPPTDDNEG